MSYLEEDEIVEQIQVLGGKVAVFAYHHCGVILRVRVKNEVFYRLIEVVDNGNIRIDVRSRCNSMEECRREYNQTCNNWGAAKDVPDKQRSPHILNNLIRSWNGRPYFAISPFNNCRGFVRDVCRDYNVICTEIPLP